MVVTPPGAWNPLPWPLTVIPSRDPHLVERSRITDLVSASIAAAPLTVISAPSGFGKTVAAAEWARTRDDVVWVSTTSISESFQIVRGGLLQGLPDKVVDLIGDSEPGAPAPDPLDLISLVERPFVLVIDDAHFVDAEAVRATIAAESVLATGLLRVVLVGQPQLELSYARELATGIARAITGSDLSFTPAEGAALVANAGLRDTVNPDEFLLETGGWPVAMRLRLICNGAPEVALGTDPDRFQQRVRDYMQNVVFAHLDPALTDFLLAATTCSRADIELVQLLTSAHDAAARLDECRRLGLFLDCYSDASGRVIYRWHDTFAAHAQAILRHRDPSKSRSLHLTAAAALAAQDPALAIEHALQAENPAFAADLVRRSWLGMLISSQTQVLLQHCVNLPDEWRNSGDILNIRACCHDLQGEQTAARSLRSRAANATPSSSTLVMALSDLYLANTAATKAEAADRAYSELISGAELSDNPEALFFLGWVETRLRRDPERAIEMLRLATQVAETNRLADLATRARGNLAFALTYGGYFSDAATTLIQLESMTDLAIEWDSFDNGMIDFSRGYAEFWRGDLSAAFASFTKMIETGGNSGSFLGLGRVYYALTVCDLGMESAFNHAEYQLSMVSNDERHGVPWETYKRVAAVRLLEARGKIAAAKEVAQPVLSQAGIPVSCVLMAEFFRRVGEPAQAQFLLSRIDRRARPPYAYVSSLVTSAALSAGAGNEDDAHRHLERALRVAEDEGSWYPFLGSDPTLAQLLRDHPRKNSDADRLLRQVLQLRAAVAQRPVTVLTSRETELLGYLRTAMTTQEIADELHLSINTIKTHLGSIYRKLGVDSRRGAVRLTS